MLNETLKDGALPPRTAIEGAGVGLSIVVPLFDEADNVILLCESIVNSLSGSDFSFELILVNDGSRDNTSAVAKSLAVADQRISVIDLHRNFGQTAAMASGISVARGDWIVTLDGDLQNDPGDIPMMVEKAREGFDIVVGWRHQRKDNIFLRTIPSVIANRLIGLVTGIPIRDNGCSLKVFRADLIKRLPIYSDMHRFLPALVSMAGARIAQVKVRHHPRQHGQSKYGLSRVYKVLIDLIIVRCILSLVSHPSRWFARIAALPLLLSSLCIALFLLDRTGAFDNAVIASLGVLGLSFGVFIMALGLLCEITYARSPLILEEYAHITATYPSVTPAAGLQK